VHRAVLARNGVVMLGGVQYDRIDDQGLHITVGGEQRLLSVDNVVICAGQDSLAELMPSEEEARPTPAGRASTKSAAPRWRRNWTPSAPSRKAPNWPPACKSAAGDVGDAVDGFCMLPFCPGVMACSAAAVCAADSFRHGDRSG
jgi:hypothetical protein